MHLESMTRDELEKKLLQALQKIERLETPDIFYEEYKDATIRSFQHLNHIPLRRGVVLETFTARCLPIHYLAHRALLLNKRNKVFETEIVALRSKLRAQQLYKESRELLLRDRMLGIS